ncbi:(Fe-S)-binding protein [Candidatus Methanomassiliicoccus intestinalis]|uniref:(Fe-S)-binding protein n=1 Tax=Candidatus Methanomassiliicoccus intestinalis TaxID=1406512 RepID=UPI0037DD3C73
MADYIECKNLKDLKTEMMTCTMCGFCKSVCPAFENTGWDRGVARGRMVLSYGLMQKEIPADKSVIEALYQCTTCKDCERRCPSKVRVVDVVESARRDLVAAGNILPQHEKVVKNILQFGNPFGEEKSVPETLGQVPKKAKVGYFVGCTSAYRNTSTAKATISILTKLGEDFTLVNEVCCGSVMQRVGWSDADVAAQMQKNIDAITAQGVETVVFSCAGCYRMFKEEYPKYVEVPFKVLHISEYLDTKDLPLAALKKKVTYHDPCHLGRHAGVYKAPRNVLAKIPEIEFKEMARNSATSRCCGGGGGVRSAYPDLSAQIAADRVEEASFADILVTSCPFCVNNLKVGKDQCKSDVEIVDLVELVESLL